MVSLSRAYPHRGFNCCSYDSRNVLGSISQSRSHLMSELDFQIKSTPLLFTLNQPSSLLQFIADITAESEQGPFCTGKGILLMPGRDRKRSMVWQSANIKSMVNGYKAPSLRLSLGPFGRH